MFKTAVIIRMLYLFNSESVSDIIRIYLYGNSKENVRKIGADLFLVWLWILKKIYSRWVTILIQIRLLDFMNVIVNLFMKSVVLH